jgi:phosphate transport system substrate-binding protein
VGQIPGLEEFVAEFTSDQASGEEGYLTDRGLIPLSEVDRASVRESSAQLVPLEL